MSSNVQAYWHAMRFGLFVCVPVGVAFADTIGYVSRIDGVSMQPTLNPEAIRPQKDYVFANRFAVNGYKFKRGEIVTLINPRDHKDMLIKRIVGLPGDFVRLDTNESRQHLIPDGHCWVEGDNHNKSNDSNSFGPVPMALIQTKVKYVVWPPSRVSKLEIKEPSGFKVSNHRDPNINEIRQYYDKRKQSKV